MNPTGIKDLLLKNDSSFWVELARLTRQASGFDEILVLSTLRKKAELRGLQREWKSEKPLRLAIVGGYSLYPFHELLTHLLETAGIRSELLLGDYDNYIAEIMEPDGKLAEF